MGNISERTLEECWSTLQRVSCILSPFKIPLLFLLVTQLPAISHFFSFSSFLAFSFSFSFSFSPIRTRLDVRNFFFLLFSFSSTFLPHVSRNCHTYAYTVYIIISRLWSRGCAYFVLVFRVMSLRADLARSLRLSSFSLFLFSALAFSLVCLSQRLACSTCVYVLLCMDLLIFL